MNTSTTLALIALRVIGYGFLLSFATFVLVEILRELFFNPKN